MARLNILVVFGCFALGYMGFAQPVDDAQEDVRLSDDINRPGATKQQLATFSQEQKSALPPLLLYCYACQNCDPFSNNTTPSKICNPSYDPVRNRCVVYTEKYKNIKKPLVTRGCAVELGTCARIRASREGQSSDLNLVSCEECDGDLCNTSGAGKSLPSVTVAIIALLVTPLLAIHSYSLCDGLGREKSSC